MLRKLIFAAALATAGCTTTPAAQAPLGSSIVLDAASAESRTLGRPGTGRLGRAASAGGGAPPRPNSGGALIPAGCAGAP